MRRIMLVVFVLGLSFFTWHWQVLAGVEKSGETPTHIEEKLLKILGTDNTWKPDALKDLKFGMRCDQVKKIYPAIICNDWKKYDFPKVPGKPLGMVKEYEFTFSSGKLESVLIVFNARLFDAQRFGETLLNVAQRKWGTLAANKLKQPKKNWYNADRDTVSLSYSNGNWQVKVTLPKREAGETPAPALVAVGIRESLAQLLGTSNNWVVPVLSKFHQGMYCDQVLQIYKTMEGCEDTKNWSWGTVTIKGHPLVQALKFAFNNGQLKNAVILFHPHLDKGLFKNISLELFEQKWGKIDLAKRNDDILTIYKENYGSVQRSFRMDHWEIKLDFPQ